MQTSIKNIGKTQKEIRASLPFKDFEKYVKEVEEELIKQVELKGFRKGQVPRSLALEQIDKQKLMIEAANRALKVFYPKIIKENNLEPIGSPQIEVLKLAPGNDFEFKAVISFLPEIKLPDYRGLAKEVKKQQVFVSQEDIEKAFQQVQAAKDKMTQEQLAQIDFDKPEKLKEILKQDLERQKQLFEKQRIRNEILDRVVKNSEIEVPEILLEAELKSSLEQIEKNISETLKMTFEDYLKKVNKSQSELEEDLKKQAEARVKRILVLKEIQRKEEIKAEEQEIKREIDIFMANLPQDQDKDRIREADLRGYFKERLEQEKTLQFLETLTSPIIKP